MAKIDYPCRKCLQNILDNMDCICCDNWLHVNCSGLTFNKFKKINQDIPCIRGISLWKS